MSKRKEYQNLQILSKICGNDNIIMSIHTVIAKYINE